MGKHGRRTACTCRGHVPRPSSGREGGKTRGRKAKGNARYPSERRQPKGYGRIQAGSATSTGHEETGHHVLGRTSTRRWLGWPILAPSCHHASTIAPPGFPAHSKVACLSFYSIFRTLRARNGACPGEMQARPWAKKGRRRQAGGRGGVHEHENNHDTTQATTTPMGATTLGINQETCV